MLFNDTYVRRRVSVIVVRPTRPKHKENNKKDSNIFI